MNHYTVAAISLSGISLDVLGGLYLAYDLLGGRHGPLRLLTRMVTYSLVFGIGYGIGLGFFFGAVCGAATGITIAVELHRIASKGEHYAPGWEALCSVIRGLGFGAGLTPFVGLRFATAYATLVTLGQVFAYTRGMRPGMDYSASGRPRLSRGHVRGVILRTAGYTAAALICSAWVQHIDHAWLLALHVGLVTGIVTAAGVLVIPIIEYYADSLPERRLGVFGILLVFSGFALQSLQYWIALLDVPLR